MRPTIPQVLGALPWLAMIDGPEWAMMHRARRIRVDRAPVRPTSHWTMYRPGVHLSWRAIWARPDLRSDITALCAEIAALGGVTTDEAILNVREFYQAFGGRP